jgi:methionyl aminopeptidase
LGIYLYSEAEIKKITQASNITALILDEIEHIIEIGITTDDIDAAVVRLCKKNKVIPAFLGYNGFSKSVCVSINEEVVHGIPNAKRRLADGDIVGVDFGVICEGYFGDSARTVVVGGISKEAEHLINITKESLYVGISKAVEGNRISDISHAIEEHVSKHGFSPVRSLTGHGIGKHLHEEPSVPNYGDKGQGPRIKNGMVFAIEPMINQGTYRTKTLKDGWTVVTEDGKLSAHFEHTVAVVNGKAEILTKGKNFN